MLLSKFLPTGTDRASPQVDTECSMIRKSIFLEVSQTVFRIQLLKCDHFGIQINSLRPSWKKFGLL